MQINNKFHYEKLERDETTGIRLYKCPNGELVSSVTTILDATKSPEAKASLASWRKAMGDARADQISTEAATRGTIMHSYLERILGGESPPQGTNFYHKQAWKMAHTILESFLKPNLTEIWGLEARLYYTGLFAGTTDLVGIYDGVPSIMDFKQTNKPKTDDRVIDYKTQLCAYASAHDSVHGTAIKQGVIMMCSPDLTPQTWVVKGDEFKHYTELWWNRVADYYAV